MGGADALVCGLLAVADLIFLVFLRQMRGRKVRDQRMMESLRFAVERELASTAHVQPRIYLRAS
jgi:hypothetical protein